MDKKKLIIVGVLAVVSFTVAFFATGMMSGPGEVSAADKAEQAANPQAMAIAAADQLAPRGEYLENMIRAVMQKDEELRRHNRQLDEREKQLTIAQNALHKDAQALENLRVQLAAPLLRLKEMKTEIDNSRLIITKVEMANLKRMAKVYEKMPSEQGGMTLTDMCLNNQIEDAARLLYLMSEKGAAKILTAMSDGKIKAELFKRLKVMNVEG